MNNVFWLTGKQYVCAQHEKLVENVYCLVVVSQATKFQINSDIALFSYDVL